MALSGLLVALIGASTLLGGARSAAADPRFPDFSPDELVAFLDRAALPETTPSAGVQPITGHGPADDRIVARARATDYRLRPLARGPLNGAAGVPLNPEAAAARVRMAAAARAAGAPFTPVSGHRSVADQRTIFLNQLAQRGYARIGRPWSVQEIAAGAADAAIDDVLRLNSIPGFSFHHTGNAADLSAPGGSLGGFASSAAYRWLSAENYANAKRFGFVPSYPVGATAIGPEPEPWEFTYVGERQIECAAGVVALADSSPGRCPIGSLDRVDVDGTTVRVRGWAADPDAGTGPIAVHVYVDGAAGPGVLATIQRPDVAAATGLGAAHGFDVPVELPPGPHTVCAYAINDVAGEPATLLGCRAIEVRTRAPVGHLDAVRARGTGIRVDGWAADPDIPILQIDVHVYVDGRGVAVRADRLRPDVHAAFGLGAAHGFSATLPATEGDHQVCVWAITPQPVEGNPLLGCRTVRALGTSPTGSLDLATGRGNEVVVGGWAVDPDRPDATVDVRVSIDGTAVGTVPAGLARPDVDAVYGVGGSHGFATRVPAAPAAHEVCVTALSATFGELDRVLGCRTVAVPGTPPVGHLDAAWDAGGRVRAGGWAADPGHPSVPIDVHLYVDGVGVAVRADGDRPDVAAATGLGAAHGFDASVTVGPGEHTVCAYGIAVDAGEPNTWLGCRTVRTGGA